MPSPIFQEERVVIAGGVQAQHIGEPGDVDMDISVKKPRDGDLSMEVDLYNLALSTWSGIKDGERAQVSLGWMETETLPVIIASIDDAGASPQTPDAKYNIKGVDESATLLDYKTDRTWNNRTPDQIAVELAAEAGLGAGQIDSVGEVIEDYWSVNEDRPTRYWLDQLVQEAQKRSEEQWEWYAEAGRLHFIQKDTLRPSGLRLDPDLNLLNIGKASGKSSKTGGSDELEFECMLEPAIHKDIVVQVNSVKYDGAYRVVQYEHSSSTTGGGNHHTSGTLVDVGADYDASLPGRSIESRTGTGVR